MFLACRLVFVEVFESTLNLGQQGGLRCSVKAPTDSNITVTHNNRLITTPFSSEDSNCDHMPQISTSTQPLEEGFTLFSVMIHVWEIREGARGGEVEGEGGNGRRGEGGGGRGRGRGGKGREGEVGEGEGRKGEERSGRG